MVSDQTCLVRDTISFYSYGLLLNRWHFLAFKEIAGLLLLPKIPARSDTYTHIATVLYLQVSPEKQQGWIPQTTLNQAVFTDVNGEGLSYA